MLTKKNQTIAIKLVQDRYIDATDITLLEVFEDFHGGSLLKIGYTSSNKEKFENYVLFSGKQPILFVHAREVLQHLARSYQPRSFFGRILQIGGISGIIALMITLTICYLVISQAEGIGNELVLPEFLTNALSVILGFYFGAALYEASRN